MADQIALRVAESIVSAGSAVAVTANFRTRSTGVASTPSSVRYRVDCLTNQRNVINWTSVSAASSATISVDGGLNAIIDESREFEIRQLTVEIDTGLSTQSRQAIPWRVKNIHTFVPAASFRDDLLLEPYYPSTAAEISAGVTPTSYGYEPGDVRRYGAVGDGTTDDRTAFVAALSVADAFVPFGTYKIVGRLPLAEYGIVGEGWATDGNARQTKLVFYNQTTTTLGSVYTDYDNTKGRALPIKNVALYASSWNGTTGALGHGIDITARVDIENVLVTGFGSHGIFLHNTDTDGEAPYNSSLKGVSCFTNGGHGMVIGTGANDLYIRDYQGKWNGAPSYGVAPSVAGNYDGLFLSRDGDGNPGSAFYSYTPEGVFVIGGDCSYNSRYGWNLAQCQGGVFHMGYSEGNLTASPANMNLGNGLTHCFVATAQVGGGAAGVNFGSVATAAGDAHTNRFFIGGRDCGAGNSNTETSRYSYALAKQWNWVAYNSDQTAGAIIKPFGTDVGQLVRVGSTGGWIIEPPSYTVSTLPSAGSFSGGAMIFVTNEVGGAVLAFNDGAGNWRRVTDRAVVA